MNGALYYHFLIANLIVGQVVGGSRNHVYYLRQWLYGADLQFDMGNHRKAIPRHIIEAAKNAVNAGVPIWQINTPWLVAQGVTRGGCLCNVLRYLLNQYP